MADRNYYYSIGQKGMAEFREKGSRFLALAFPLSSTEEFKKILSAVKKENPKATHHCFAWRLGMDGNQFRVSDDSEPSGSAGRPILGQIDHLGLTNVLVIVVRYFGGTRLGLPGLTNAYKTAAALVLQVTPVVEYPVELEYLLEFDYARMNEVMTIARQFNCRITSREVRLFCRLNLAIPRIHLENAMSKLKSIPGLHMHREDSGTDS